MHSPSLFWLFFLSANLVSSTIVDPETFAKTSLDFIIAGGGTAGVALAVRLSEVSNFTVGIIEAGDYNPDDPRILIPQGWNTGRTWGNADYDWGFYTTPQKNLANREVNIVRGKVLGGSSAVNLMGYFLAGGVEYDQIGQLGNDGWSYNSTLHYFKKSQNMSMAPAALQKESAATFSPRYHGRKGPVHASFSSFFSLAIPPLYNALVNMGLAPVHDGGDGRDGNDVWDPPLSIDQETETRSYSANAYYAPNADRPNLYVVLGARVTQIHMDSARHHGGELRATGVAFMSGGQNYTATSNKEIIVCGGSIQSPQMLELSGIGNKTLLESLGIESRIDLPGVGENYQEHLVNYESFIVPNTIETWDVESNPAQNATAFAQYVDNRTGPYTASVTAISYFSVDQLMNGTTNSTAFPVEWLTELDQQFNATNPTAGQRAMYEIQRARLNPSSTEAIVEVYAAPFNAYPALFQPNTSYIQIASVPSHPFSRGSIHINTSNPLAYPSIDLNAFALDIDRHIMVQSAKLCRQIALTEPLASVIQSYGFPGPNVTSDADWEEFVAETVMTPFHPCCTNAMLPREHGGVVDSKLKVYGTSNLRVADVSILPLQLATHLMGTAYSIAEQAADMIKAEYGY